MHVELTVAQPTKMYRICNNAVNKIKPTHITVGKGCQVTYTIIPNTIENIWIYEYSFLDTYSASRVMA